MIRLPPNTPAAQLTTSPKLLTRLHSLGIQRAFDLVLHLPLRYEDERRLYRLVDMPLGEEACTIVTVLSHEIRSGSHRQLVVQVADASGRITLRFLHFYPNQLKLFQHGRVLRVFGEIRPGYHGPEMIHPRCRVFDPDAAPIHHLTPVYRTCAGLPQATLRRLIRKALDTLDLTDPLPETWRQRLGLPDLAYVLETCHNPPSLSDLTPALSERLKFDELLAQQISFQAFRRERENQLAAPLLAPGILLKQLLTRLPFSLTRAQHQALDDVRHDLSRPYPMHRLLQGDVGCGKTIVATLAAILCLESGYQAALMAPTELLAQQHHERLTPWLAPLGLACLLLTSRLGARERLAVKQRAESGDTVLVVGTHALIQKNLNFAALGLVIIDEQHRFGVDQRLDLVRKGSSCALPHLLMMSATPIPRSLSMSYYADLDISTIDELPPGRQGITTKLVSLARRQDLMTHVLQACRQGQQAYWVCPLIEESEQLDLQNAVEAYETWCRSAPDLRCGLLHGKLAGAEKARIMEAFFKGEIQILVATSVIEVGVDVPQATLMVIEHAERMGLAQLHQMRGRVGRGLHAGFCFLLYDTPLSDLARQRLKVIYESNDGFNIAHQDLQLRGPGDYLGARQSGVPLLRFADPLKDERWLAEAQHGSRHWLAHEPEQAKLFVSLWLGPRQPYLAA